jgi:hypothetical protein
MFSSSAGKERAMTENTETKKGSGNLADTTKGNGQDGAPPPQSKPWAFIVVVIGIVCVTVVFLIVWLMPTPAVFNQSSQIIAVLSATFGVIGTLVGTYFGIKTTGDARDTVERVQKAQQSILGGNPKGTI